MAHCGGDFMNHIETFTISRVVVNLDEFTRTVQPRLAPQSLTSLTLNYISLDCPEADALLKQFPNLKRLDLSCNPLGPKFLPQLAKLNLELDSLSLYNCGLGSHALEIAKKYRFVCRRVNISYNQGVEWALCMFKTDQLI